MYQFYYDIKPKNHCLIAGSTGSGKSVILNGMISHLLYTNCELVLIDLKRVELVQYKRSHRTIAYCDTIETVERTLYSVLNLIDKRYQIMTKKGLKKHDGKHLYIVIDELADLLTIKGKKARSIENSIIRIMQIGRAANVHVIGCTQTLLSKVISTQLSNNFDMIIGLRVRTRSQSNLIIKNKGLETLPVYGNCCIITPGKEKWYYNVPIVSDEEIKEEIDKINNDLQTMYNSIPLHKRILHRIKAGLL